MDEKFLTEVMHRWQFVATWENDIPQLVDEVRTVTAENYKLNQLIERYREVVGLSSKYCTQLLSEDAVRAELDAVTAERDALRESCNWICIRSVDTLPKNNDDVEILLDGKVMEGYFSVILNQWSAYKVDQKEKDIFDMYDDVQPTFWRPLPEPPHETATGAGDVDAP